MMTSESEDSSSAAETKESEVGQALNEEEENIADMLCMQLEFGHAEAKIAAMQRRMQESETQFSQF